MSRLLITSMVVISCFFYGIRGISENVPNTDFKNVRLIRKVYLDILNVPPTVQELEWLLVYTNNGYESAVKEVLNRPTNIFIPSVRQLLKHLLLSNQYKSAEPVPLNTEDKDFIIKYQSGIYDNIEEANKRLVLNAIKCHEPGVLEGMDYIAESLMGRDTTAEEATSLSRILQEYPNEEEGYLKVLEKIKTFKDFNYK